MSLPAPYCSAGDGILSLSPTRHSASLLVEFLSIYPLLNPPYLAQCTLSELKDLLIKSIFLVSSPKRLQEKKKKLPPNSFPNPELAPELPKRRPRTRAAQGPRHSLALGMASHSRWRVENRSPEAGLLSQPMTSALPPDSS